MYSYVASSLNTLRIDSEARSILRELERLKAIPENQKRRFIWELIQNAKDSHKLNEKVQIFITLDKDRFIFAHNGCEFRVKDLVALVRRASTKPFDEDQGKTGRSGTGFMTTHVVNTTVEISGPLVTPRGVRSFSLVLQRSASTLRDMKILLEDMYRQIDSFTIITDTDRPVFLSKFEYRLEPATFAIVQSALEDLKRNITFTLAINENIESITISTGSQPLEKYHIRLKPVYKNVLHAKFSGSLSHHQMLVRHCDPGLVLGVHCEKSGSDYFLTKVKGQPKIFKDFPIIGTEDFNCAPLIQSHAFCPSDLKDGIRLRKTNESDYDPRADTNRGILLLYRDYWITFIRELMDLQVLNRYILAESGLPRYSNRYSDNFWFRRNVQLPLRQFLKRQDLVRNSMSTVELYYYSRIDDCLFPECSFDPKAFHKIASEIITKSKDCPESSVFQEWNSILNQDYRDWGLPVKFTVESLIALIEGTSVDYISKHEDEAIAWLSCLVTFLRKNNCFVYLETRAILPSQNGILRRLHGKNIVRRDGGIDEVLKDILCTFGDDIRDCLLHPDIADQDLVPGLDCGEVLVKIERKVRELDLPAMAAGKRFNSQVEAALMMSILNSGEEVNPVRSKLSQLLKEMYPSIEAHEINAHEINETSFKVYQAKYFQEASLRYLSARIDCTSTITDLSKEFPSIKDVFEWLNELIFILEELDMVDLLSKYAVLPLQNGRLTRYHGKIVMEDDPESYENDEISFKKLINQYVKDESKELIDCSEWLLDNRIKCQPNTIRREPVAHLTTMLDKVFSQVVDGMTDDEDRSWCRLFHTINIWCGERKDRSALFPIFSRNKGFLVIQAYGIKGSEIVAIILDSGKEPETVRKLCNLASEIELLEKLDGLIQSGGQSWIDSMVQRKDEINTVLKMNITLKEWEKLKVLLEKVNPDDIADVLRSFSSTSPEADDDASGSDEVTGGEDEIHLQMDQKQSIWKTPLGLIVEEVLYQAFKQYPLFKIERCEIGKDFVVSNPRSNQRFSIEVREIYRGQSFINLGKFHALTACVEKAAYALCIVERSPSLSAEKLDRAYFKSKAKFVTDIGSKIEAKIKVKQSLENNESICIAPRNTDFSVLIFKETWMEALNFDTFFLHASKYLFSTLE